MWEKRVKVEGDSGSKHMRMATETKTNMNSTATVSCSSSSSGTNVAKKVQQQDPDHFLFHFHLLNGEAVSATLADLQKLEGEYFFGKNSSHKPKPKGVVMPIRLDDVRIGCAMLLTQMRQEGQDGSSSEDKAPIFPSSVQFFPKVEEEDKHKERGEEEEQTTRLADDHVIVDKDEAANSGDKTARSFQVVVALEFSEPHVEALHNLLNETTSTAMKSTTTISTSMTDSEIQEYITECHRRSPGKNLVPLDCLDLPPELRAMWKFSKTWRNPESLTLWGDSFERGYWAKTDLLEDLDSSEVEWREEDGLQQRNNYAGLASAEWLPLGFRGTWELHHHVEYFVYIRKDKSVDAEPYQEPEDDTKMSQRRLFEMDQSEVENLPHVSPRFGEVRWIVHAEGQLQRVARITKGSFRRFIYYAEHVQRRADMRYGDHADFCGDHATFHHRHPDGSLTDDVLDFAQLFFLKL
ncbi:unnamed protein product [Amoebophrya sp. A25]|nr:unnamed protein product [Amoebophrya sp. A25]|eukprot:GSA25T00019080001.1